MCSVSATFNLLRGRENQHRLFASGTIGISSHKPISINSAPSRPQRNLRLLKKITLCALVSLVEDWLQEQLQLAASEREAEPKPIFGPGEIADCEDDIAHLNADLGRLGRSSKSRQHVVRHIASQFLLSDGAPRRPSPLPGDCCVYGSFATVPCPLFQAGDNCCA